MSGPLPPAALPPLAAPGALPASAALQPSTARIATKPAPAARAVTPPQFGKSRIEPTDRPAQQVGPGLSGTLSHGPAPRHTKSAQRASFLHADMRAKTPKKTRQSARRKARHTLSY